jgi:CRISPR-associated exonuclease Cas4
MNATTVPFDETPSTSITASVLLEYLFCPRFIYFMNCLCIEQHQEKRYKVQKGREVHHLRESANVDHLRKRIGCVAKEIDVYMSSKRFGIHGIVDEVLTLSDGTMAPLDYKYAEYKDVVYRTHKYQSVFYGLLIKENYGKKVNNGFICYTRSSNLLKEVPICEKDFADLQSMLREISDITRKGFFPTGAKSSAQCIDCCYRNICV